MKILPLLFAILILWASAATAAPYVVFIGDSITAGWPLDAHFDGAVNKGIPGQSTDQMLARFQTDVVALAPRYVVILGGTNGVGGNGECSACVADILAMVLAAKNAGITPIVGLIPPRVWGVGPYNDALRAMAIAQAVETADFFNPMRQASGNMRFELFIEGINSNPTHPNSAGYAIMAPIVRPLLAPYALPR